MAYVKQNWNNDDANTPLSGSRLNHIEDGIADVDAAMPTVPEDIGAAHADHDHVANDITDATEIGKTILTSGAASDVRTAISAGTSNFSGDYGDLSNKPTVVGPTDDLDEIGRIEQERTSSTVVSRWITRFTGTGFATSVANIAEHYISILADNPVTSNLASWLNEWGALRGTSPYKWGDALVRGIRTDTDELDVGDGSFIELSDRRNGETITRYGRKWRDGSLIRNGQSVSETYTWQAGDPDPTFGGTVSLPSGVRWIIRLASDEERPSWVPAGSIIVRS